MTTQHNGDRAISPTVSLLRASARGKLHGVIRAINEGAQLAVNENGHTALHIACHKGFLDIVRTLLAAGCSLDIQDDKGDTALHRACIAGHDLVVRRLIEEGCSVDRQNQLGDGALHEAASRGYSRCVLTLIKGRANIGLRNKNEDTPIHLACSNSHTGSLRLLLSSYPHASPKNKQGDSPLHIAVRFGHVTCTRVLLSARCTVDLQNKRGDTALHVAAIARQRKLVRILLDAGASSTTVRNVDGKSALDIAKDNDDGETAVMLISGPRHKTTNEKIRGRSKSRNGERMRSYSLPRRHESRINRKTERLGKPQSNSSMEKDEIARPNSATLPRKSYVQARANWKRHERMKLEDARRNENVLETVQRQVTVNPYVVPQLYSLYRDDEGNIAQRPVVEQLPNPTPEIVNSIAVAVESSKGELLHEIKKTNQLLENRLGQIESKTDFKVAKLDQITKERINAERMQCLHRIDRRATLERAVCACRNREACASSCGTSRRQNEVLQMSEHYHEKNLHGQKFNDFSSESGTLEATSTRQKVPKKLSELQPYQTIKFNRGRQWQTETNDPKYYTVTDQKATVSAAMSDNLNRCDSAYGSLSQPRQFQAGPSMVTKINIPQQTLKHNHPNHSCNESVHSSDKDKSGFNYSHVSPINNMGPYGSHHLSDGEAEVAQKVTEQCFENMILAMEDWYERRLRESTERQQREFNARVSQIENKLKLLETRTDSDPN